MSVLWRVNVALATWSFPHGLPLPLPLLSAPSPYLTHTCRSKQAEQKRVAYLRAVNLFFALRMFLGHVFPIPPERVFASLKFMRSTQAKRQVLRTSEIGTSATWRVMRSLCCTVYIHDT